jgi:hypothetical protein
MTGNTLIQTARSMAPNPSRGMAFVYFLRLRSGSIYVGCTIDLEQRLVDHQDGVACEAQMLPPGSTDIKFVLEGN